jgi:VWFA-related protein
VLFSSVRIFGTALSVAVFAFAQALAPPPGSSFHDQSKVSIIPRSRPAVKPASSALRIESTLVIIPVTVTDMIGKPMLGLDPQSFQLFEDGVEQRITHFANDDAPVSVGILFDASGSMEKKIDKSREAVARLFRGSDTGDEYSLVSFADQPQLLSGFSADTGAMQSSLMSIVPRGWTALFDAISLSIHYMKKAVNPRKALVIISDGGDNNSRYTKQEIKQLLRESDASIFAIGILGPKVTAGSMKTLSQLAEETGGRMFAVDNLNDLPDAIGKINLALHNQYVLGYSPTNGERDGKYRKIRVNLIQPPNMPRLRASWRWGYYAPF